MPTSRPTGSWRIFSAALLAAVLALLAPASRALASSSALPTWSVLSPPTSPPALRGAAAAYDAANHTVVVFGGQLPDGALSDQTWVWDGTTWSRADQGYGAIPAARQGASMAYDSSLDQLILFGGEGAHSLLDDTWLWNGASWIEVNAPSTPGARSGAAFAAAPGGQLVLFGGYGYSNSSAGRASTTTTTSSTTATSTTTSGTSGSVPASTSTSTSPPKTTRATDASGTSGPSGTTSTSVASSSGTTRSSGASGPAPAGATRRVGVLGDTWLLESTSEGDNWVPATTPVHPAPAVDAMAVGTGNQTVLFGGRGSHASAGGATSGSLSDRTWSWGGRTWSLVRTVATPPARAGGVLVDDRALGGVVAFGGSGAHGPMDDQWILRGHRWERLTTSPPPAARSEAVGVYDAASRQVLVFGGATTGGRPVGGTVVLAAHPPVPVESSPSTTTTATTRDNGSGSGSGHSSSPRSSSTTASTTPTAAGGSATSSSTAGRRMHIHPGDVVTLDGSGFTPGARVVVTFEPTRRVVAVTRANHAGQFRVEVTVPDGAKVGVHDFRASGQGRHGPVVLVTPVQVAAYTTRTAVSPVTTASLVGLAVAVPVLTLLGLQLAGRARRPTRRS